jgi:hypothetical protein
MLLIIAIVFLLSILLNLLAIKLISDLDYPSIYSMILFDDQKIFSSFAVNIFFIAVFCLVAWVFRRKISKNYHVREVNEGVSLSKYSAFLILVFYLSYVTFQVGDAFLYGIYDFINQTRSNQISIGWNYLFLLIAPVIIIVVTQSYKSKIITLCFFTLITVFNLITGFRLILIWTFIVVAIFYYKFFKIESIKNFLIVFLIMSLSLYYYEGLRSSIENFGDPKIQPIWISLSRSNPITNLLYVDYYQIQIEDANIFSIIFRPFQTIFEFIFSFPKSDLGYEVSVLSEGIYRDYLIFIGTPDYQATGFSIHVVPFLYAHSGLSTVFFGAIILGVLCGYGLVKLDSSRWDLRTNGALICAFVVGCNESPTVAWGLFIFGLLGVQLVKALCFFIDKFIDVSVRHN